MVQYLIKIDREHCKPCIMYGEKKSVINCTDILVNVTVCITDRLSVGVLVVQIFSDCLCSLHHYASRWRQVTVFKNKSFV